MSDPVWSGSEPPVAPPATDGLLASSLRGRVLAAMAAAFSLWQAAGLLWAELSALLAEGYSPEHAAAAIEHAGIVIDGATAVGIAAASAVSLVAALASKLRDWWRRRRAA